MKFRNLVFQVLLFRIWCFRFNVPGFAFPEFHVLPLLILLLAPFFSLLLSHGGVLCKVQVARNQKDCVKSQTIINLKFNANFDYIQEWNLTLKHLVNILPFNLFNYRVSWIACIIEN